MAHLKKLTPTAFCVLISFANTTAYAQDRCDAILRNGIWEYTQSNNTQQVTESFLSWFCSQSFGSFGEARDQGLKIGIPIENIPVEIDGHNRENQWSKYYS